MRPPTFPKHTSLTGRALALFLKGDRITHRDFQKKTASYRLSVQIDELRNRHEWPIDDVWLEAPTSDKTGRRAKFKRYFINAEDLAALRMELGVKLDKFVKAVKVFEARRGNENIH